MRCAAASFGVWLFTGAPESLHHPVDRLHSVEKKPDAARLFRLTEIIEGVKQDRSLTVSNVFPVGAASGGQAKSPSTSQDDRRRASKAL